MSHPGSCRGKFNTGVLLAKQGIALKCVLDHLVAELFDPLFEGCEVLLALVFVVDQEDALQDGRCELR